MKEVYSCAAITALIKTINYFASQIELNREARNVLQEGALNQITANKKPLQVLAAAFLSSNRPFIVRHSAQESKVLVGCSAFQILTVASDHDVGVANVIFADSLTVNAHRVVVAQAARIR